MSTTLIETVLAESSLNVDREAGVIHGVKVLGEKSKNGRRYSRKAMQEALRLYEGAKVNVDHPPREKPGMERGFADGFGELRAVGLRESGMFADLHYIKSHPLAGVVAESAERFPRQFGLSHNAEGEVVNRDGERIVESISEVRSVDIVSRPATNEGLFESEEDPMPKPRTLTVKQILESAPDGENKKRLQKLVEQEGTEMAAMPVEAPAESDPNEDVKLALAKAAQGIVKKMIDGDLDDSEGMKKLRELLTMAKKTASDSPSGGGEVAPVPESIKESIQQELAAIRRERAEQQAERLLEDKGIEVTPVRVKALVESKDEAIRKEFLELWPRKKPEGRGRRPVMSPPLMESEDGEELPSWCKPRD